MSEGSSWGQPPLPPSLADSREEHWMHFDSSVNAISFGFVATAILISMFLVMAIFERFLRQRSQQQQPPAMVRGISDPEAQLAHAFPCKLEGSPPTVIGYPHSLGGGKCAVLVEDSAEKVQSFQMPGKRIQSWLLW